VEVVVPDADPEQYAFDPVPNDHEKAKPPEPPLTVVCSDRVCPWSAEHADEQDTGEVSTTGDKVGSL
jgi:hypothetical protein